MGRLDLAKVQLDYLVGWDGALYKDLTSILTCQGPNDWVEQFNGVPITLLHYSYFWIIME
jgi:hypothetical protein